MVAAAEAAGEADIAEAAIIIVEEVVGTGRGTAAAAGIIEEVEITVVVEEFVVAIAAAAGIIMGTVVADLIITAGEVVHMLMSEAEMTVVTHRFLRQLRPRTPHLLEVILLHQILMGLILPHL